jgi:hypothetical protein
MYIDNTGWLTTGGSPLLYLPPSPIYVCAKVFPCHIYIIYIHMCRCVHIYTHVCIIENHLSLNTVHLVINIGTFPSPQQRWNASQRHAYWEEAWGKSEEVSSEPPHPAPELLRLKKLDLGLQFAQIFFIRLDSWDTRSSK